MKQIYSITNTTAATIIGISIAAVMVPAYAVKTYDVSDLRGTYNYNLAQVRNDGEHCTEFGTLTFDGVERGVSDGKVFGCGVAIGTDKCGFISVLGDPVDPPEMGEFKYTVETDGQVEIDTVVDGGSCPTGPFEGAPAHAQITDNGRILLIDGTTRPGDLIFNGVAVEQ